MGRSGRHGPKAGTKDCMAWFLLVFVCRFVEILICLVMWRRSLGFGGNEGASFKRLLTGQDSANTGRTSRSNSIAQTKDPGGPESSGQEFGVEPIPYCIGFEGPGKGVVNA